MSLQALQEESAPGGELFAARREAREAIDALIGSPAPGLRAYAERAQRAADALNNLASLAALALRREQKQG